MNYSEEADFYMELWSSQNQQRKIKKERLKNKKEHKTEKSQKVHERKNKLSKFKEAMMERREKKKERRKEKKKKRNKDVDRDEHQMSAASDAQQEEIPSPECQTLRFMEKSRTKKVQFASFPPNIRVKRPTFSLSSPKEAVRSCQSAPVEDDSQCPSEDINSQDLFITQKSFGTSFPQELSSSEASDRAVSTSPLEANNNRQEDLKESRAIAVHPHLDEPFGRSSSLGQRRSSAESSTQTENFFTAELCSFFSFCQRSRTVEDLKPLDLSLPQRERARTTVCLTMKAAGSSTKDGRSTRSPHIPTDLSFSSEEDHPDRSSRREMIQVRAVQMKLNKPFFFKTKGQRLSPRPESPLMKLSQGRAAKSQRLR